MRICIVEHHELVRDAMCRLVDPIGEVVGTSTNGREAVRLAQETKPDLMLMDVALPELNGLDAGRQIKKDRQETRLIFVTCQTDLSFVREAFGLGASGYVLKQSSSSELLQAIDEASDGNFYISSLIKKILKAQRSSAGGRSNALFCVLTRRQREVLQLVAEGKTEKEIASNLQISVTTVAFHKTHLKNQLKISTLAGLIRYAVEEGLVCQ